MPCYHPLDAWQTQEGEIHFHQKGTQGKKGRFIKPPNYRRQLDLPCGRCVGCRIDKAKQWAVRIMHEAQQHEKNSFITLTLSNKTLDARALEKNQKRTHAEDARTRIDTIEKRDIQLFVKRLRKYKNTAAGLAPDGASPLAENKIKYYAVGEYGEKENRPHYHAAIFGENFTDDKIPWRTSPAGFPLWRSPTLEKLWTLGHAEVGELTFESAAYIARYVMKKINGDKASEHYQRVNPETGELTWITPEFALMSRGGRTGRGIGSAWLTDYRTDVYPNDYVVMNGQKLKPPRYYDKLLEELDKYAMDDIRIDRERKAANNAGDNTPARLAAKEAVAKARLSLSKRQ